MLLLCGIVCWLFHEIWHPVNKDNTHQTAPTRQHPPDKTHLTSPVAGPAIYLTTNIAFARGGVHLPIAHALRLLKTILLVRVKLGHPPNFNFLGKPLLGEKYVEGKRRKRRIMPSLVATTSTPARKPFVRTHYVRTDYSSSSFFLSSFHAHTFLPEGVYLGSWN